MKAKAHDIFVLSSNRRTGQMISCALFDDLLYLMIYFSINCKKCAICAFTASGLSVLAICPASGIHTNG